MRIDLNMANMQAKQMQSQTGDLRDARHKLMSFGNELNNHWRGQEMTGINNAVDNIQTRLASSIVELDEIAALIMPAAQEVRRLEDLADARAMLQREETNVLNMQRAFDHAGRQHAINPTAFTQTALNTAQRNLNNAIQLRNEAAARVQAFMR